MFTISLVCFAAVFVAINAYQEYDNSRSYTGPKAERYTDKTTGKLCYVPTPMYNFAPQDIRIVTGHNFVANHYLLNPEYRPLFNFYRG